MNSTLAQTSHSVDRLAVKNVGFKSCKTPIAATHSSFLSAGCATKKKRNQFPLPCLRVRVAATQASTSEDLKAALSHFPAQTQLAKHSFTSTANIRSSFFNLALDCIFTVIRENLLLDPPPGPAASWCLDSTQRFFVFSALKSSRAIGSFGAKLASFNDL